MVGGTVINVVRLPDSTWVQCLDRTYAEDTCAVRLIEEAPYVKVEIKPGDSLWWQSDKAYWTPQGDTFIKDVALIRIGNSHRAIPEDVLNAVLRGTP